MPEQPIKDKTAVAGVGWTAFTKASGTSALNLAAEACLNAIADAGLSVADIDGISTFCTNGREWEREASPHQVALALGMENCNYQGYAILGGSSAPQHIASAAMAIYSGLCKNVLVFRSQNRFSDRAPRGVDRARNREQWLSPIGAIHASTNFGPSVVAHMARYGTTSLDLGHVAVAQRKHAVLNTKAMMRKPLTIEEHQESPLIVSPFHLFDLCLNTDGAVAVLVTSAERAKDLRHAPVYISSFMGGTLDGAELWETNAERAAPRLYEGAGITAADVDFAELYDASTGVCILHMEGFGLAEPGEAGRMFREGETALDGKIPVNTHGGLLSEAYFQALNHIIEAVQQLRPEGVSDDLCEGAHDHDREHCRQLRDPNIGLVCGELGHSSIILTSA